MTSGRGKLISFEGIEGCGKSTQLSLAANYLARREINLQVTVEPGGSVLGEKIRHLLLHEIALGISPEAEMLLFSAARAQHVQELILPALMKKTWVLCDRFTDATLAYQGYGRGLDIEFISSINKFVSSSVVPDMTILFDLPVWDGLVRANEKTARLTGRKGGDRIEAEALDFHQRIRDGYLSLARKEPDRIKIIDARNNIATVHGRVCGYLETLL